MNAGLLARAGPPLPPDRLAAVLARAPWRGAVSGEAHGPAGSLYALGAARLGRVGPVALVLHGRIDNLAAFDMVEANPAAALAALYLRHGEEFAGRLLGDFALALLDDRQGTLLGARDWIGARPLFWGERAGVTVFASEVKQILALLDAPYHPNEAALAAIESWSQPDADATFANGVYAVLPNSQIVAALDRPARRSTRPSRIAPVRIGLDEATWLVRERLERAVARRTVGAVRLGAQISGGMDSTAVVALAAAQAERGEGPPVAVGFTRHLPDVPACDETGYARAVAARWGIPLEYVVTRPPEIVTWPVRGFPLHDGPTAPGFASQANLMAAAAAAGVDVVLTGTGGDYWLRQHGAELELAILRRDWRLLARAAWIYGRRNPRAGLRQAWEGVRRALAGGRAEEQFELHLVHYFNRAALEGMEREAMRHGLRVEFPFGDRELGELLAGLPPGVRALPTRPKRITRLAVADLMPPEVLARNVWTTLDAFVAAALGEPAEGRSLPNELGRRYVAAWRELVAAGSPWSDHPVDAEAPPLQHRDDERLASSMTAGVLVQTSPPERAMSIGGS